MSYDKPRPAPYEHIELKSVEHDKHRLVELSLFNQRRGGLNIGKSVFEILPTISSRNSSYWTMLALNQLPSGIKPRIRLDPLMCSPLEGYAPMCYRMYVYGRPLTWETILNLNEEVTQRWMPDYPEYSRVVFTDVVWTPRENEVHLRCEECPKSISAEYQPSRYFHSIIDRGRNAVIHCDGAIRIMTESEARNRESAHVRDAGKVGIRVKLFQIDQEIPSEHWMTLFKAFFVWNSDIERFANGLVSAN